MLFCQTPEGPGPFARWNRYHEAKISPLRLVEDVFIKYCSPQMKNGVLARKAPYFSSGQMSAKHRRYKFSLTRKECRAIFFLPISDIIIKIIVNARASNIASSYHSDLVSRSETMINKICTKLEF